jgi:hypothetical protein
MTSLLPCTLCTWPSPLSRILRVFTRQIADMQYGVHDYALDLGARLHSASSRAWT